MREIQESDKTLNSDNESKASIKDDELSVVFSKAIKTFPSDSSSLYWFYYKSFPAKSSNETQSHIKRIEDLLKEPIIKQYNQVTNELKPLLTNIVESNSVNKEQSDRLVHLYIFYDAYSGEALFSNLLTDDENYTLVWKSFEIMADQTVLDTCYISSLISLENAIRTNVELAEAMGEFVIRAIKNNPEGFLKMYSIRSENGRNNLSSYAMLWDDPVEELKLVFKAISENSSDSINRVLAKDLLTKIEVVK